MTDTGKECNYFAKKRSLEGEKLRENRRTTEISSIDFFLSFWFFF